MNDKKVVKTFTDSAIGGEAVSVTKRKDQKIVGYVYGDSDGKYVSAHIDNDSNVEHKYEGKPPRNKDNELLVAAILTNKLNKDEIIYDKPLLVTKTDEVIDCISKSINSNNLDLKIQVVNSIIDSSYWKKINAFSIDISSTFNDKLAKQILEAIKKKIKHYDQNSIKDITLALDATNNPQHALTDVYKEINDNYYGLFKDIGFYQIWIVGPNEDMTYQIY